MNLLSSFFISVALFLQVDLSTVRSSFEKADSSKEQTASLYNSLKDYSKSDPLMLAYKGAAYGLQARYVTDRKEKKNLFLAGAKDLEAAVRLAPNNVEIRLVRLIIQENTPKVLKYKGNINEDKQMILTNFDKQTKVVKEAIRRYASSRSKLFTANDLKLIN